MDPKLKLEPGLCDRYMIQQKGGSGTQFMEIDILNFGSFTCTPYLVRFYLPVRLEEVCMFMSANGMIIDPFDGIGIFVFSQMFDKGILFQVLCFVRTVLCSVFMSAQFALGFLSSKSICR
jgi:hypothetical protein